MTWIDGVAVFLAVAIVTLVGECCLMSYTASSVEESSSVQQKA